MPRPRKNSEKRHLTYQSSDYEGLIRDLSSVVEAGRNAAVRSVNVVLTTTYWLMGRRIVEYEQHGKERAEYGAKLLNNIGSRLVPKFGRGFNDRNLEYMRQFYLEYSQNKKLQPLVGEISWTKHLVITYPGTETMNIPVDHSRKLSSETMLPVWHSRHECIFPRGCPAHV